MIISLLVEFMAMGVLVACITGLNYTVSLILGAIAILIYTGAGGYLSVAYTDFVQSILMIIGLFILIPVCIHNVGGLSGMNAGLININEGLATLWGEDYYLKGAPLMIAGIALVYFIGYMGQPHLIIKTVAIKDEKSIKLVPMIGAAFGFVFILRSLYPGYGWTCGLSGYFHAARRERRVYNADDGTLQSATGSFRTDPGRRDCSDHVYGKRTASCHRIFRRKRSSDHDPSRSKRGT